MNPAVRFRKNCQECGRIFFTSQREGNVCPRCVKQVAEREEKARRMKEKKAQKKGGPSKIAQQDQALPQTLTEELKDRILQKYEPFRNQKDLPRRKIHGLISKELRVTKKLVAQALPPAEGRTPLTREKEEEIVTRYREYVEKLERPPKGRRKTIAQELGLPYRSVAGIVREWKRKQPPLKDLTREQRFSIEKDYFRLLEEGQIFSRIKEQIVRKSGHSPWQVSRYLDLLHDGEDRLKKVIDATPEQSQAILAGYREYLSAPAPPTPFLHTLLAEKTGVTHQQVHKVLLTYRLGLLGKV